MKRKPSSGLQALTHAAKKSKSAAAKSLRFINQPPRFPFLGAWFPIHVAVLDEYKQFKTGMEVDLLPELFYGDMTPVNNAADVFEIHPNSSLTIPVDGQSTIHARFGTLSMHHPHQEFVLKLSCANHNFIQPVLSRAMTCVRHRIKIMTQPPDVWYKDEGGQNKSIVITAKLVDCAHNIVKDRPIPLDFTLLYGPAGSGLKTKKQKKDEEKNGTLNALDIMERRWQSKAQVLEQKIMRISTSDGGEVVNMGRTGEVEFRFRVDEVRRSTH